jgi:hypothetical protein
MLTGGNRRYYNAAWGDDGGDSCRRGGGPQRASRYQLCRWPECDGRPGRLLRPGTPEGARLPAFAARKRCPARAEFERFEPIHSHGRACPGLISAMEVPCPPYRDHRDSPAMTLWCGTSSKHRHHGSSRPANQRRMHALGNRPERTIMQKQSRFASPMP